MPVRFNRRVLYSLASLLIIVGGTLAAIQYAKGNIRISRQGVANGTGLLSANSFPTGAEVLINGELRTATDDTLYLDPGDYQVQIRKDGYSPWNKNLSVQRELVTQTNAQLFPIAPSLTPLTFTGVERIHPSPDGQKIIYYTSSTSSPNRNGLYLLELTNSPLSLQRGPRQITDNPSNFNLVEAEIIWSPDSSEVMLISSERKFMLNLDRKNELSNVPEISARSKQILTQWENEMYLRERQYLREFPPEIIQMATTSAKNVYFSPDKKKLLYTATASGVLKEGLTPPLPATNNQPQDRKLVSGGIYVYDREEDKNFKVGDEATITAGKRDQTQSNPLLTTLLPSPSPAVSAKPTKSPAPKLTREQALAATNSAVLSKHLLATDLFNSRAKTLDSSPSAFMTLQASESAKTASLFNIYHTPLYSDTFQWFPDSNRLMYISKNRIQIKEYDGTNDVIVYAGPYAGTFVYPWPDGSKLLVLTSFSSETPNNLYGIELK